MTAAQNRGKSVAPSPLSQSTSAVHLQSVAPEIHIPRKLSKRQTPTAANVFNPPTEDANRKYASAPATPVERAYVAPIPTSIPSGPTTLPKRMSVAPALPYSSMQPTPKKEKRGSMLNRLAKKFSLIRKLTDDHETGSSDWWNHIDKHEAKGYNNGNPYEKQTDKGRSSPEKPRAGSAKRVPPPSAEPPVEPPTEPPAPTPTTKDVDRASLSSFDTPYSMGKLTIANPDMPDSNDTSVGDQAPPVPPEKPKDSASIFLHQEDSAVPTSIADDLSQQPSCDVRAHLDKPLPPPQLATPQFSLLGLSELQTELQTPKVVEEPLPPTPLVADDARSTVNPSPRPEPPEKTKASSILSQEAPSQERKVSDSVFLDRERTVSPAPIDASVPRKTSPVKDVPSGAEVAHTRHEAQSPLVRAESVKRRVSRAQNSPPLSPEASTSKRHALDKAANVHTSREARDRSGETSSSSYHTKDLGSNSHSESSTIPTHLGVPFLTAHNLAAPDNRGKGKASQLHAMEFEGSPMSTSSMLANPPTPYENRLSIALSDQSLPPTLPPKSIYEVRIPPNPTTTSPSRQTETFKLVRSLSGNVYASSETITAAGQQWEVVESVETKPRKDKSSSKSKEQDYRSRDRDREYRSSKDQDRSREYERSSKDYDNRAKDDRKSRDYEHRLREYDLKMKDDRKSRDYEHRSRDYEPKLKDDRKSRDYEHRSKDYETRSREYGVPPPRDKEYDQKPKEDRRHKDYERKSRDYEPKPRDEPRSKDEHRQKEVDHRKRDHERRPDDYDQRPKEANHRSKDYERKYTEYDSNLKDNGRRLKDFETSSRKEKELKPKLEESENRRSSHKTSKQPVNYQEEPSKTRTNGKSNSYQPEQRSRYEEPRSSRKKDDYREPKVEKKPTVDPSSSSRHHHTTTSVQYIYAPAEVAEPPPRRLERNPSTTARPTSELPSAAEMNAVRAKESWEMERLWKARSMYGLEPNGQVTNYIPESGSSSSRSDDVNTHSAVYGSSHTAYVVQSPFQTSNLGSQIYHSMPTGPPPIIYSSPASIPSIPDTFSSYEPYAYDNIYRSYATATTTDYTSPPSMPRPTLNNPLPEPPRESAIDLSSLKAAAKPSKHTNNDYWTKYNGITTAH